MTRHDKVMQEETRIDKTRIEQKRIEKKERKPRTKRVPTLFLGIYKNVALTEKEYETLKNTYEQLSIDAMLDKMSRWLEGGKTRDNHYQCLNKWVIETVGAVPKPPKKEIERCPRCNKVRNETVACQCGWSYSDQIYLGD
jgi:hypothetical protein